MALTTLAIVKQSLGLTGTTNDVLIDRIIRSVDVAIARYCNRLVESVGTSLLERQAGVVEYPKRLGDKLVLRRYPIESVAEIKQATDRDFDNATALVEGEDYVLDDDRSDAIAAINSAWYGGLHMIRVTYTGGYWTVNPDGDPAGPSTPAGAIALPADLHSTSTMQVVHEFKHRNQFGERQITEGDMTVSQVKDGLLEIVRKRLEPFKSLA